ncbi:MAG: hypothetical protein JWN70_293, partial [Planctomycetaceae bacterium]|nr:hypothetical protein [Planctomycetaceae bacterium]
PNWSFRSSFSRPFWIMTLWAVPIALSIVIYEEFSRLNFLRLVGMIASVLIALPIVALLIVGVNKYLTVEVNPIRIRSSNQWGWYSDLPWADIAKIRPINFSGLTFMRLYSKTSRKVLWIPLFLTNMDQFLELALEFTEPDNPLHQFADARLKDQTASSVEPVAIRIYYH